VTETVQIKNGTQDIKVSNFLEGSVKFKDSNKWVTERWWECPNVRMSGLHSERAGVYL